MELRVGTKIEVVRDSSGGGIMNGAQYVIKRAAQARSGAWAYWCTPLNWNSDQREHARRSGNYREEFWELLDHLDIIKVISPVEYTVNKLGNFPHKSRRRCRHV